MVGIPQFELNGIERAPARPLPVALNRLADSIVIFASGYVNDKFSRSFGAANCAEHCELFLHAPALFRRTIADKVFVSKHIYYHDCA